MLDFIFKLACELYQNSHISFKFYDHPFLWWSIHGSRINAWYLILCDFIILKQLLIHSKDSTTIFDYDFHWNLIFLLMKLITSLNKPHTQQDMAMIYPYLDTSIKYPWKLQWVINIGTKLSVQKKTLSI
jgi:hypothetical protein